MQHHLFHLNPYNSISTPKVNSHYNCYMLLGYDILISKDLQAHLIGESVVVGHIPRGVRTKCQPDKMPTGHNASQRLAFCPDLFLWLAFCLSQLFGWHFVQIMKIPPPPLL